MKISSIFTSDVDSIKDFHFSPGDMVGEKQGKINKDYTLMNPPLGKGYSSFFLVQLAIMFYVHKKVHSARLEKP